MKFRRLKYSILIAVTILMCGPARAQVNADQVLEIGRNVLSIDDYLLSIQYFNLAIKAKPYLADPYLYRGLAKLYLEDYAGAEQDCSLALERNKFKTLAYKVRGFARQMLRRDSLAIEDYDQGLEYDPYDKYFIYYKGVAQTDVKDYQGAAATFERLHSVHPNFQDGYTANARLDVLRGDTVAAISMLDHAIEISRGECTPFLMRAELYADQKNWEKASLDMDEAIKLIPDKADFYVNRAYLRYNSDDYFGAMSDYNYAIELEPENVAALFNRALLRYEVRNLTKSAQDLGRVLTLEPDNFHARYNRALIALELNRNKEAMVDFKEVIRRYPKFYPAYYGIAQAYQNQGDLRSAMQWVYRAEDLVKKYVKNPKANPLDRPAISPGKANSSGETQLEDETEIDVMDRFNQLVTVSATADSQLSFNEKIKGKVQDRDVRVELEPDFTLSFRDDASTLRSLRNYFRELDDFNQGRYLDATIYLAATESQLQDEAEIEEMFGVVRKLSERIDTGSGRPADYVGRGVAHTMLKDYAAAADDFTHALALNDRMAIACIGRGFARYAAASVQSENDVDPMMAAGAQRRSALDAIADYDRALVLNPRLIFAWFNKGNIYYKLDDLTSALGAYSEAISINPDFGEAYYNRGLTYLRMGNKASATADLRRAGELGVIPAYNVLKRMK